MHRVGRYAEIEDYLRTAPVERIEILKRRDRIVGRLERLAKERGAGAVFPF